MNNLIDYATSAWSILPPALALILAIATRRVILSLSVGILAGSVMLTDFNLFNTASYIFHQFTSIAYAEGAVNWDSMNIIIFLLLLGVLIALFSESGSNEAFANWATQHVKTRRGAKLMTASLAYFAFIDDYFHSLAVGAIARPITDKYQISRPKLAYILDSTAAPICVMTPVSSWGAYIITLVAGLLTANNISDYTPLGAFMSMTTMNFYAIFSILTVVIVSYFTIDIGPMARFEAEALHLSEKEQKAYETQGHVRNLVLPILFLIGGTISMMMYTGGLALAENGKPFTVLGAFENTTVGISLVAGGMTAVLVASLMMFGIDRLFSVKSYVEAWLSGMKSMKGAITILIFAWTINSVVGEMKTGMYLSTLVSESMPVEVLPALLFLLSAIMAFCTGTSWGTFGIMLPIGLSIALHAAPELLMPCMSAVMAGAVCGDHCSPISDTTILSSTGARCDHMEHVMTQLPYALIVASATLVGYLVVGFTQSAIAGLLSASALLISVLFVAQKH